MPNKAPEQTPSFSSSTCLLIPKDSLNPVHQLTAHLQNPMRAGPTPLWSALPANSPSQFSCPTTPPMTTQAKPISGLNQENQKLHIQGAVALGSRAEEENRAISQEIPMGLSQAPDLRECFPHCLLFSFSPYRIRLRYFLFSQGEKITVERSLPV